MIQEWWYHERSQDKQFCESKRQSFGREGKNNFKSTLETHSDESQKQIWNSENKSSKL